MSNTTTPERDGLLVPFLGRLLPALKSRTTLLGLFKRTSAGHRWDKHGKLTDVFVLVSLLALFVWLLAVDTSTSPPWIRVLAVIYLIWRSYAIALVAASWVVVERGLPNPRRSIALFCCNLLELRLMLCLVAVLTGMVPVADRWGLFLNVHATDIVSPWVVGIYRLLSWVIVALAVGAVAGYLRQTAEPAS